MGSPPCRAGSLYGDFHFKIIREEGSWPSPRDFYVFFLFYFAGNGSEWGTENGESEKERVLFSGPSPLAWKSGLSSKNSFLV